MRGVSDPPLRLDVGAAWCRRGGFRRRPLPVALVFSRQSRPTLNQQRDATVVAMGNVSGAAERDPSSFPTTPAGRYCPGERTAADMQQRSED